MGDVATMKHSSSLCSLAVLLFWCVVGSAHAIKRSNSTCAEAYVPLIEYSGCHTDSSSVRTLSGLQLSLSNSNAPHTCAQACGLAGFSYSGVEYSE